MEFSRQEYWSGLPFPSSGDLPDPGIKLMSPVAPALAGRFFTTEPPGEFKCLQESYEAGEKSVPKETENQHCWLMDGIHACRRSGWNLQHASLQQSAPGWQDSLEEREANWLWKEIWDGQEQVGLLGFQRRLHTPSFCRIFFFFTWTEYSVIEAVKQRRPANRKVNKQNKNAPRSFSRW